ncbi:MAG: RIP metalloprotease RseP [Saprospiraceae bacterium]|nr:RIP metalloprotease RseP [Saprospiraceae bacterium]|tara:strand:- start:1073 stop:2404 length:1332 start_codon:yes stop_codon:yes gene_type:complete
MDLLITIAQFMLSLCILIILHECGHFFPAKWFKTKVEKFYLFFDPYFSLFSIKKGETEYGIGWLPLGGYVKIAGMVDESFDTDALKEEPKEWEFRSKPAWQRLIIMLGGVTVNFILGILLFAMILWHWGESYIPTEGAKYGMVVEELGEHLGLQDGDLVLSVGSKDMDRFESYLVKQEILFNEAETLVVKRNGREITLNVPENYTSLISAYENREKSLFTLAYPNIISEITSGSNAQKAGLLAGDQIIGVNGIETPFYVQFASAMSSKVSEEVNIKYLRSSDTITTSVMVDEHGKLGYFGSLPTDFIEIASEKYAIGPALGMGCEKSYNFIASQIKAFGQMFRGKIKAQDSLGSFISIGGMFGSEWDWHRFWNLTAMLSILLAFINLLPIPALDGGHVMFLLFEVITGVKPSDKVLQYATMGGFFLIMMLMIYAVGLDIMRLF